MKLLRLLYNKKFLSEFLALYGVQVANIIIPLVMLPILGRSLGPKAYGSYVIMQSIILLLSLVVEFGFAFSGTRLVAKSDNDLYLSIVSDIFGAKIILSIFTVILSIIIFLISQGFNSSVSLYELVIIDIGALAIGWMPTWYFQGRGILSQFASIDVCVKLLSIIALFFLVKDAQGLHIALIISVASSILICAYGNFRMLRQIGNIKIGINRSFALLVSEKDMAIYRFLSSSIGNINAIILGNFTSVANVANFAGAEKLAAGSRFFIAPFNQIFFARVARYGKSDMIRARKEFLYSFWLLMILALFTLMVGWALAPKIIGVFLGKGFSEAIEILRYLLLITPLYVFGNTLSMQWMVPFGMDKTYNYIIGSSAIINIILLTLIVPKFETTGIVIVVGIVESLICISMLIYLHKVHMNPFSRTLLLIDARGDNEFS